MSKICPFCAEEIKEQAIVCKHCGKSLDEKDMIKEKIIPYKSFSTTPTIRCRKCGYEGKASMKSNSNGVVALLLFILLIIPWILYYLTRKYKWVCPKCENDFLQEINKKTTKS